MRSVGSLLLGAILLLPPAVSAAAPKLTPSQIKVLHTVAAEPNWSQALVEQGDFLCDRSRATVAVATSSTSAWVAVIPPQASRSGQRPLIDQIPIRSQSQGGMCGAPIRISAYPHTCKGGDGNQPLADCTPHTECADFAIEDDLCDPFNFYWSNTRHQLLIWRN